MKLGFLSLIIIAILFSSCQNEPDPYLVTKKNIGYLTDSTQVKDLKIAFPNDSIVNNEGDNTFNISRNLIEIFGKDGNLLLTLTPHKLSDSTATISNIRIEDDNFKTEKGISTLSTFKDIQEAYKISKIDNLINSIVISVNEINAQFAIDKQELPSNLRHNMDLKIEAAQIPDGAKIKYFFINWD